MEHRDSGFCLFTATLVISRGNKSEGCSRLNALKLLFGEFILSLPDLSCEHVYHILEKLSCILLYSSPRPMICRTANFSLKSSFKHVSLGCECKRTEYKKNAWIT